jgi:hypothetical protein
LKELVWSTESQKKLFLNQKTMKRNSILVALIFLSAISFGQSSVFIEAESFANKGGWFVDQQFMDIMGSSYLLAHGMGVPVANAETEVEFPENGDYHVYVRTFNWTSVWQNGEGPANSIYLLMAKKSGLFWCLRFRMDLAICRKS